MSGPIAGLQAWYQQQCNGEWEHQHGVKIDTLDNPGWKVEIDLGGTSLQDAPLADHAYGVGDDSEKSGDDWLTCKRDGSRFLGHGGPLKLEEILQRFLAWEEASRK